MAYTGSGSDFLSNRIIQSQNDKKPHREEEGYEPAANMTSFIFTGNTTEYFRIWIVNIFLSIITLGVYSPWAKVRKQRYFYSNTLLQNTPFEYLADPIKILIGRFIVFALFVAYYFLFNNTNIIPERSILLFITEVFTLFTFSWLSNKALMFKTRYSSYRNIRFDFRGGYGKAFFVIMGSPWGFLYISILPVTLLYCMGPQHLYLEYGEMDDFIAGEQDKVSPIGEEAVDLFDFDIGL